MCPPEELSEYLTYFPLTLSHLMTIFDRGKSPRFTVALLTLNIHCVRVDVEPRQYATFGASQSSISLDLLVSCLCRLFFQLRFQMKNITDQSDDCRQLGGSGAIAGMVVVVEDGNITKAVEIRFGEIVVA